MCWWLFTGFRSLPHRLPWTMAVQVTESDQVKQVSRNKPVTSDYFWRWSWFLKDCGVCLSLRSSWGPTTRWRRTASWTALKTSPPGRWNRKRWAVHLLLTSGYHRFRDTPAQLPQGLTDVTRWCLNMNAQLPHVTLPWQRPKIFTPEDLFHVFPQNRLNE